MTWILSWNECLVIALARLRPLVAGEPSLEHLEDLDCTAFQVHAKLLATTESLVARQQHLKHRVTYG